MNCITKYCKNETFGVWHAPAGYSLTTYPDEPMHYCPACGAKWRGEIEIEQSVWMNPAKKKGKLYEMFQATQEFRAATGSEGTYKTAATGRAGRREP